MTADASRLRNVGIVAHVDAGKTTVTEHMLHRSGHIRKPGSVDAGTAQTDWLDVERERGISVRAATTVIGWGGCTINLIDTPGHVDFSAEVERALRVLDGAVVVVSAAEGVQAHTETLWRALQAMRIPTVFFINKIDRIGADPERVLADIRRLLTPNAIAVQRIAYGEGELPELYDAWRADSPAYDGLLEATAEADDEVMERYVIGETVAPDELRERFGRLSRKAAIHPVLYGVALKGIGIEPLMDAVVHYLPAPSGNPDGDLSGVVFKVERDKTMGRIAYVRLYEGAMHNRDAVFNTTRQLQEKITQIRKMHARHHEDVGSLAAGDIAAVCGMSGARIGDVLGNPLAVPEEHRLSVPLLTVQAFPLQESDYQPLVAALQELTDEDPLLDLQWLQDERELHVKVMGTIQLEVLTSILRGRFGLQAKFGPPSVIYKETPSRAEEGFVAYTMPKPCWAVLRFLIEPGERGSGLAYRSVVRAEQLLPSYQNEVERRVPEALQQGMFGWEVTDLKVTLLEGEHHVYHTHPLDFVVATPMGIMDGLARAGTTLLEPLLHFRIAVPEEWGGRVLSDLATMRATFDNPVVADSRFTVEGTIPVATSLDYPVRLASMSGGRGAISTRFAGYEPCPPETGKPRQRRGVNPLDTAAYILSVRNAFARM